MSSYTWIATLCTLLFLQATVGPGARAGEAAEVEQIVEALAIEPGSTVADMGAGDGDYSVALARHVGANGIVYATEIEADKRESIEAAVKDAQLGNVRVVEANGFTTRDVIHHQRYGLENHLQWLTEGRPGGSERFRETFGSTEAAYLADIERGGRADSVILVAEAT